MVSGNFIVINPYIRKKEASYCIMLHAGVQLIFLGGGCFFMKGNRGNKFRGDKRWKSSVRKYCMREE